VLLVTKLQLGNAVQEAPASRMLGKLELPLNGSQAGAWEPGYAGAWEPGYAGAWEPGYAGAWELG